MAPFNSLLSKISTPGLWIVKSKTIIEDISRHIYDFAVKGGLFLQIYSSGKERIVNAVISMITKDRLRNTAHPDEHCYVEKDISDYYEHGTFWMMPELNDFIPTGSFWENQVRIRDFDPLFLCNCSGGQTILIDDIDVLKRGHETSPISTLKHINTLALQEGKTVIIFVYDKSPLLTDDFISNRLI